MRVYLAGPIFGCDVEEANNWRQEVACALAKHDIRGISPLRCEPSVNGQYELSYDCPKYGTPRAIAAKNNVDVHLCDALLAYMPTPPDGRPQSLGTVVEMALAHDRGKPVILVSNDRHVLMHPLIDRIADWKLETLHDAVELIISIFIDYV